MRGHALVVLLGGWVLLQVPKDLPDNPPIEKTKRVRTFDSAMDCENYRGEAMKLGAEVGADAMLDEASTLRCVRDDAAPAKK